MQKDTLKRYLPAFILAGVLHAGLLMLVGWSFIEDAEFGVQLGQSSIEVDLVAAPTEIIPDKPPKAVPQVVIPQPPEPEESVLPEAPDVVAIPVSLPSEPPVITKPAPRVVEPKSQAVKPIEPTKVPGDSSSQKPGEDPTSLQSSGGSITETGPFYLKNPPPAYPEICRRLRQEGVVLLSLEITAEGKAKDVRIKESSGFKPLDEAALKAVKIWKFLPARMGSIPVSSQREIPVRFDLGSK